VSASEEPLREQLRALRDRVEIIEVVGRFAFCIDRRLWDELAACFTDEIKADTIRTGGWVRFERSAVIEVLRRAFESYTATQHISANHQVTIDGDTAVVWSTLNATHYRRGAPGGEFQQQVGYYEYGLVRRDGWKISSIRQHPHWQTGNQQIFDSTLG
jgi:hypothetical protein